MKRPSFTDATRCLNIRFRSKRGETVSAEDHEFCTTIWKAYPTWYKNTEADVWDATRPIGGRSWAEIHPKAKKSSS